MIRADVMRALVHIEANLEGDLSTPALAAAAGLSASRFHRVFVAETGATPHEYVTRLRLDRAAFHLATQKATIPDVAVAVGYPVPETFTRAFARRFDRTPSDYRAGAASGARLPERRPGLEQEADRAALSVVRPTELQPQPVAFLRHIGPYESVDGSLFDELAAWARGRTGVTGPWLGVGHDAPGITGRDQLRFDVCVGVASIDSSADGVAFRTLPGAWYATATHTGPYDTLPWAHRSVYEAARAFVGYRVAGLPVVECYLTTSVRPDAHLNTTQIRLPLTRLAA